MTKPDTGGRGEGRKTLYLCKMEPRAIGEPTFVAVVGRVVECSSGYKFLPETSAHKASRKIHPTANSCIPRWTERLGFLRLLDGAEMDGIRKANRLACS